MQANPASIAIVDSRLPGGCGLQLAARLREMWSETEVILITGFASLETAIEGVRLGACDYLVKPFEDLSLVAQSIDKALARIEGRRRDLAKTALFNRLSIPIVLVDTSCTVRVKNRIADALLRTAGFFVDDRGRIAGDRTADVQRIHGAVAKACGAMGPPITVALERSGEKPPERVVVVPVSTGAEPLAAIVLGRLDRKTIAPAAELLCALYGLTQAEGAVAVRIVAGDTLQQGCDALGIAITTGRTHLSRVFAKTGTSSQSDLVGLVLSGPALFAGKNGR
jgi:FixJ family two-component response regulator